MYKRILVAIDNSTTAQKALGEAIALARALGANLCIANAADEAPLSQHGMGLGSYIDVDKVKEEMRAASNSLLAQALAQATAAGCQAEVMAIESAERRLASMIVDAATTWNADLIVMGSHGRSGLDKLVMGSVTQRVLQHTHLPVLVVRD